MPTERSAYDPFRTFRLLINDQANRDNWEWDQLYFKNSTIRFLFSFVKGFSTNPGFPSPHAHLIVPALNTFAPASLTKNTPCASPSRPVPEMAFPSNRTRKFSRAKNPNWKAYEISLSPLQVSLLACRGSPTTLIFPLSTGNQVITRSILSNSRVDGTTTSLLSSSPIRFARVTFSSS